jgi:hypothetical protein
MELVDNRKLNEDGEVRIPESETHYDDFRPTLVRFEPVNDSVLLRELKLPDEGMIVSPDAYAEPCLYCEVIAGPIVLVIHVGDIVRILKGIGTTIQFSDTEPGQRYFTVNYQDIIGKWAR